VRALEVTGGFTSDESLEYLSGLLIGDEIRSALAKPAGMPPILIGEPALCARYRRALSRFGIDGAGEVEGAALAGLFRIATAAGLIEAATEAEP
jgi:2-dehydro-3-deoxygalactonokinase